MAIVAKEVLPADGQSVGLLCIPQTTILSLLQVDQDFTAACDFPLCNAHGDIGAL